MLNDDYKDILRAFAQEKVRYLLVGAYAMAAHGHPRATMDIDLWVEPSEPNAQALLRALQFFGAPLEGLTANDFLKTDEVLQLGVAPRRIDILTGITDIDFSEAFDRSDVVNLDGIQTHVLSLDDLIRNKKATGRTQDRADVEALERLRDQQ